MMNRVAETVSQIYLLPFCLSLSRFRLLNVLELHNGILRDNVENYTLSISSLASTTRPEV